MNHSHKKNEIVCVIYGRILSLQVQAFRIWLMVHSVIRVRIGELFAKYFEIKLANRILWMLIKNSNYSWFLHLTPSNLRKNVLILSNIESLSFGGRARGVMVIYVGHGHGDTSSNPRRDWLHFT